MRNANPSRTTTLLDAIAFHLLSLSLKSPSRTHLALSILQRSTLKLARRGNTLRLLDAADLLSPCLSNSSYHSRRFSLRAPQNGSFKPLDPPPIIWVGFINLISARICAILANWVCKHLMGMSLLSSPSRNNRLGFCLETTLSALFASLHPPIV